MLIPTAYAEPAGSAATPAQGGMSMLFMFAIIFVVSYFIMIRPKMKKEKEHRKLVSAVNKGDEIVTYSGMMGKIVRLTDDYAVIDIAENTEIKIQRNYIANVLPKGTLKSI